MSLPKIILKDGRALPLFARHPWVFAGSIDRLEGTPADGDEVAVHSSSDVFIARGLYNSQSKITVRLYCWTPERELDESFWRETFARAIEFRRRLGLISATQACRLIYSEGDELSGLVVEKFGDWLVMQFTSLAMARRAELFADILTSEFQPRGIHIRTEKGIGKLEGLEMHDSLIRGESGKSIAIEEGDVRFLVDLEEGQKTGFYIDQRDNHRRVAELMAGRNILDAFCYSGGFGLHCARWGAESVLGVDVSESALELARKNAELNGLANVQFVKSDVFDFLNKSKAQGKRYEGIILDPPKFARSRNNIPEAMRGYRRLLRSGLELASKDAILVMCCCSGLISQSDIEELLIRVAADARRFVQIIERRGQAPDHPVSLSCPETSYLKCIICRAL